MALYHQYRPQQFADVVGQSAIVQTLSHQIIQGTFAHAYLFSGPRGVGKTSIARIMAKAITCPRVSDDSAEPDNTTQAAKDITASRSVDVIEIDAASHTGVDHVREHIIEQSRFHPSTLSHKIFIIDEVHMLSTSAFNALLKTLEEPPAHVIFILATTELHKVPATIISRCQRFQFRKVATAELSAYIESVATKEGVTLDPEVITRLVHVSDGCVRDAISLLEQVCATGDKHISAKSVQHILPHTDVDTAMEVLTPLLKKDSANALAAIQTIGDDGSYMESVFDQLMMVIRDGLITRIAPKDGPTMSDISQTTLEAIHALMEAYSNTQLVSLLDMCTRRKRDLQSAPSLDMPMQLLVIEWMAKDDTTASPAQPKTVTASPSTTPKTSSSTTPKPAVSEPPIATTTTTPSQMPSSTPVAPIVQSDSPLTIQTIKDIWPQFLQSLEQTSPSLIFILKSATISSIDDNTLILAVPFAFHQNKLLDPSCKTTIEASLEQLLGTTLHVAVVVEASSTQASGSDISDLAAAFGGEVVS